jgi:tRNA-splicing ligase RtcB
VRTCSSPARVRSAPEAGQLGIIPGQHGRAQLHRARPRQPGELRQLQPRRRPRDEPHQAKKRFTVDDQVKATAGVECRKDAEVIDEIPMAYKDIDAVMAAQQDLVEVVHTLKQVLCVKG